MKLNCYSVFDTKAGCFGTPFFLQNEQVAIRMFGDLVNDPQSMVFKHPEDYILYVIGEFEDSGARLIPQNPVAVVNASSMVRVSQNPWSPEAVKARAAKELSEVVYSKEIVSQEA